MSARRARKGHGSRGAVLVETALVVGVILTMLLFSIQAGVLGFLQLTFDAASFVDARLAAVGVADTTPIGPANATHAIFPQVAPSQIVSTVAPAPSPSVPVDYGYNSVDATTQANSITNRHGGVSMMLPTQQISTITKPAFFSIFGKKVGVASQSIDALWLECGIHVNVSNANAGCSPTTKGVGSAAYQGNYFTAGEDAPPYFVGLNHFHHCTDIQPYTTCSTNGTNFLAIGTAAFLHGPAGGQIGNWTNGLPGTGGDGGSTTFWLLGCHQRAFATIAAALAPYPTLHEYYDGYSSVAAAYGSPYPTNGYAIWAQMYDFTTGTQYPNAPNTSTRRGMNSFRNGPPNNLGISTVIDFNQNADNYVGRIYQWDIQIAAGSQPGVVGTNSTNPENGCTYP